MVFVCRRISEHESAKKKFEKCGARCFTFSRRAPLGQLVTAECRTFTTIVGRLRAVGGSNNSGSRLSGVRALTLPKDFGNGVTKIGNGVTKMGKKNWSFLQDFARSAFLSLFIKY